MSTFIVFINQGNSSGKVTFWKIRRDPDNPVQSGHFFQMVKFGRFPPNLLQSGFGRLRPEFLIRSHRGKILNVSPMSVIKVLPQPLETAGRRADPRPLAQGSINNTPSQITEDMLYSAIKDLVTDLQYSLQCITNVKVIRNTLGDSKGWVTFYIFLNALSSHKL